MSIARILLNRRLVTRVPLRWVLLVPFVLQTVGAVALVGYLSYRSGKEATENLADQLLQQASARVIDHLDTYLNIPQQLVAMNRLALEQGLLDLENDEQLRRQLWQQLTVNPSLPAVGFWSESGNSTNYLRINSEASQKLASKASGHTIAAGSIFFNKIKQSQRRYFGVDAQGKPIKLMYQVQDDFRTTSWYRQGKSLGKLSWTPISLARVLPLLHTVVVAPVYDAAGKFKGLFTASYFLSEISLFLNRLQFSPNGRVFIMERSGDLVATSFEPEASGIQQVNGRSTRLSTLKSQDQRTRDIASYFIQELNHQNRLTIAKQLNFRVAGQRQFVQITPYRNQEGLDWYVVMVIPESDFMAEIQENTRNTVLLCLLTLGVAIASGLTLANRFSTRITRLNQASQKLANSQLTQRLPNDSAIAEVNDLTDAFNQMADQLEVAFGQIKRSLEESEDKFATVFRTSPEPIGITNAAEGRLLEVNNRMTEFYGYTREELVGRTVLELGLWANLEERQMFREMLAAQGCLHNLEITTRLKSGETRVVLLSAEMLLLEGQEAVIVAIKDISDRKQLERALQQSEAKTRDILNSAVAAIARFRVFRDQTWQIEQVSMGGERLSGFTPEELIRDDNLWMSRIEPEDAQVVIPQILENVLAERTATYEYRFSRKNGDLRWISQTNNSRWDEAQQCWIVTAFSVDITDRKTMESQLRLYQERLDGILSSIDSAIWSTTYPAFMPLYISPGAEKIYQRSVAELQANPTLWIEVIHPADRQVILDQIPQFVQEGKFSVEKRLIWPSGEVRWVNETGWLVYDEFGQPIRVDGITTDITDRKQTEIALGKTLQELNYLIENSPLGTVRWDRNFRVEQWSKQAEEIFGWTAEEVLGKTMYDWPFIVEDDQEYVRQKAAQLLSGISSVGRNRNYHKDGSILYCEWYNSVLVDQAGNLISMLSLVQNVTDRKKAEEELQQAKAAAEAANRAKSLFLANMSHELRTPLNAILGFSQLMQGTSILPPDYQEYVNLIHSSGSYLLKLINEILDLSKVEAGKITLNNQPIDLFRQLRAIHHLLSQRIIHKNLQFYLEIDPDVPEFVVVDSQKLEQVLLNLLSNAVKFTQQGRISLRVSVGAWESVRAGGPEKLAGALIPLRFEVEDTGIGMATQDLELIFDAFAQTAAGRAVREGTGLGLAISRRLVQLMGGDISVRSVLGQGSTFMFTLPVEQTALQMPQPLQSDRPIVGLAPDQPDYRILVVDDQAENRLLLATLLTRIGLNVREVTTGEAALLLWQEWQPDLIWLDICLPGLNGHEVAQRIRAQEQPQQTVIIALTAQALPEDRKLALEAGCNDYVSKPFQTEILFKKLSEHLQLRYVYAEETPQAWVEERQSETQPLTVADLAVMPLEWIIALKQTSLFCEEESVKQVLRQIPPEHRALADRLEQLTQNYEFDQILRLIEAYLNGEENSVDLSP